MPGSLFSRALHARKEVRLIKKAQVRVNEEIRAQQVRLIDSEGTQVGVVPLEEAKRHAQEAGLDLVEVAPEATPPVCKIVDYSKLQYERRRREREARKKRRAVEIKEVKMRPTIDPHDLGIKVRHIRQFLQEGHKVKVTIMFRWREMAHAERGRQMLSEVAQALAGEAVMEDRVLQMGRQQLMVLAPAPAARHPAESKPQTVPSAVELPAEGQAGMSNPIGDGV